MKTAFIDWTEESLYLYAFERRGGKYKLIDSTYVTLEDELGPSDIASIATPGIDSIYLSVPVNLLTLREQRFPFSDRDKIKDTISFELEGILLGSTNDYSIDHIVTESLDNASTVLAVCLEKSKLQQIIDLFTLAGLEPKVITSLDLRISRGKCESLLEGPNLDRGIRSETAEKELLNPSVNLRQDEHAYQGDIERFKKKLRFTFSLVLVLLILLGINSVIRFMALNREHTSLTEEIQSIYHRIFPEDKKIIDAGRQFRGNMNMLTKKKAALGGIPVLDILRDIALHRNDRVRFHEFNTDGKNLHIKGYAKSFEDVESLKNSLSSVFQDVKVVDSGATADKKIDFTIVMQEKTA